jgi:ABC-type glycerol-3-phosphate transport system substrate-binding protein
MRALALGAILAAAGCSAPSPEGAPADLAAPDLASTALTLTVGSETRPLAAYYSIYVAPFSEAGPKQVELVVTFIDPAFTCGGQSPAGLDAVSFAFLARAAGADSAGVFARSGPTLGIGTASSGWAELTSVDDRFEGSDGGAIFVGAGGSVTGEVHEQLGPGLRVDGRFTAPHCAALDFAAAA